MASGCRVPGLLLAGAVLAPFVPSANPYNDIQPSALDARRISCPEWYFCPSTRSLRAFTVTCCGFRRSCGRIAMFLVDRPAVRAARGSMSLAGPFRELSGGPFTEVLFGSSSPTWLISLYRQRARPRSPMSARAARRRLYFALS